MPIPPIPEILLFSLTFVETYPVMDCLNYNSSIKADFLNFRYPAAKVHGVFSVYPATDLRHLPHRRSAIYSVNTLPNSTKQPSSTLTFATSPDP